MAATLDIPSPIGPLGLEAEGGRLTGVHFDAGGRGGAEERPELRAAAKQLERYFRAELRQFALPLVIPCHRVVGADGRLVGYGGGLARKAQLLALEAGQLSLTPG